MRQIVIVLVFSFLSGAVLQGQKIMNLQVEQAEALQISGVPSIKVCKGTKVHLGKDLVVTNNIGEVFYNWYPMHLMNDPTSSNPKTVLKKTTSFVVTVMDSRGCTVSRELEVKVVSCDALTSESSGSMRVYPNPATQNVTVEMPANSMHEQISLKMLNALGQTVIQNTSYGADNERIIELSVDHCQPGIYFIQVISGNKLFTERIQIR